jgi:two-component system, LytTR family, sensor kinase
MVAIFIKMMTDLAVQLFGITRRGYLIGFAIWTIYGAVWTGFIALGASKNYWMLLDSELLHAYLCGLFTIPVWQFVTTFAVHRSRLAQFIWHAVVAPTYAASSFGTFATLFYLWYGAEIFGRAMFAETWLFQYFTNVLIYAVAAGFFHVIYSERMIRENEKKHLALELYAKQAELSLLKAQLNPHFLFNALNTVNALIGLHPESAREVLTKLSDVLRYALESDKEEFVPLADELAFVERYIEIEKTRLPHRLCMDFRIDEAAQTCFIPPMLLQPLVENAVRHGIAPKPDGGTIVLSITLHAEQLMIDISDNGLGSTAPSFTGTGKGLYNTDQRLQKMFGISSALITHLTPSGFRVSFQLPAMRLVETQIQTRLHSKTIHDASHTYH